MHPDIDAAVKTASVFAGLMNLDEEEQVEGIQFAIIETCINAFEQSRSNDREVDFNSNLWTVGCSLKL